MAKKNETEQVVKFVELPEMVFGRAESPRNKAIADALRTQPGDWALVAEGEKHGDLAVRIRNGRAKSFAQGVWEAKSRLNKETNSYDIYARFISE